MQKDSVFADNRVCTESELAQAKENLSKQKEELELTYLATSLKENCLYVGSAFWDDAKKQKVPDRYFFTAL